MLNLCCPVLGSRQCTLTNQQLTLPAGPASLRRRTQTMFIVVQPTLTPFSIQVCYLSKRTMIRLLRKHEQLFKNMNIKDYKRSFSPVRRSEGKFSIKYSLCTSYKIHKAPVIHGLKIHKGNMSSLLLWDKFESLPTVQQLFKFL